MKKSIEIFDTTLRDGAQGEGVSFSVSDKLEIVRTLDDFGASYIECGNPHSNPKDMDFFKKVANIKLHTSTLVSFGSTRRKDTSVCNDSSVQALLQANTHAVSIFGKAWGLHATHVLQVSLDENIEIITDTISYLKSHEKELLFDAEHFFDGYADNPLYALNVIRSAVQAGADCVVLCDTNGGTSPQDIFRITKDVALKLPRIRLGIHCHNDIGCAVANSMLAVEAGASHVQGTFTGIGERCGNTDLSTLIPNLQLKLGYRCIDSDLSNLSDTVIRVSEICNLNIPSNKPYVGSSAFAHKGGMHIDGVNKTSASFEHISPEAVGNQRKFLLSEVSGKNALLSKITHIAPDIDKNSGSIALILSKIKELEHQGYQFEAADASFELLVRRILGTYKSHFTLDMYKTSGEYPSLSDVDNAAAMLKITVNGKQEITAALGNGPVNALDLALRKALSVFYPNLSQVYLVDYKVRVLDAKQATGAVVRVLIESSNGKKRWNTIGVSSDIIAASWEALVDSIEYALLD